MRPYLLSAVAATGLFSGSVFSGGLGNVIHFIDGQWFGIASVGPSSAKGGETQNIFLTPEIEKAYVAKKSTNSLATGELFIGKQKSLTSQFLLKLGLAAAATGNAKMQGIIWDDADPQFDNYVYQYKVEQKRLSVKGALSFERWKMMQPWINASIGVGFNRAYAFANQPTIFEAVPDADFTNKTTTAFTYTIGAGVKTSVDRHWSYGIGYEFSDWGKSELNRAPGQTLNNGLKLNHLYTNSLLFNLIFVA